MTQAEERSDKGTQRQQDIVTIGLYWELLTKLPAPHVKYVCGWLNVAPVDEILSQIERQAAQLRKGVLTADSAGRIISSKLRNRRELITA
jgi:hypothetical protein